MLHSLPALCIGLPSASFCGGVPLLVVGANLSRVATVILALIFIVTCKQNVTITNGLVLSCIRRYYILLLDRFRDAMSYQKTDKTDIRSLKFRYLLIS